MCCFIITTSLNRTFVQDSPLGANPVSQQKKNSGASEFTTKHQVEQLLNRLEQSRCACADLTQSVLCSITVFDTCQAWLPVFFVKPQGYLKYCKIGCEGYSLTAEVWPTLDLASKVEEVECLQSSALVGQI